MPELAIAGTQQIAKKNYWTVVEGRMGVFQVTVSLHSH